MGHRTVTPNAGHAAYMDELKAALGNSGKDIDSAELLAITAQFVGMLIAMQDQRKMTPAMAMELVARNIEQGNASALADLTGPAEGKA
jgi:hypothetical protein